MTLILFAKALAALLMGHALTDYAFQSEAMARGKNRHLQPDIVGPRFVPTWYYWLTAHSLISGAAVGVITGSTELALCEVVAHWLIDFMKCEKWINIHEDQGLHLLCKIAWALINLGIYR